MMALLAAAAAALPPGPVDFSAGQMRIDSKERRVYLDGEVTMDRPLAWVSFEWTANRSEVQLWLTMWPSGEARHLATCHPYGAWIEWHRRATPVDNG